MGNDYLVILAFGCHLVSRLPVSFVVVQSYPTFCNPCTTAHQALLCSTIFQSLLNFMFIESVMLFNCLILCYPLLLLSSIFPSIRVFSNESALHIRWPKYWNFSISPSNEYSRLISLRIDWFDLLAVQGTHKRLLEHRSSEASQMIFLLLNNPPAFANSFLQSDLFKIETGFLLKSLWMISKLKQDLG